MTFLILKSCSFHIMLRQCFFSKKNTLNCPLRLYSVLMLYNLHYLFKVEKMTNQINFTNALGNITELTDYLNELKKVIEIAKNNGMSDSNVAIIKSLWKNINRNMNYLKANIIYKGSDFYNDSELEFNENAYKVSVRKIDKLITLLSALHSTLEKMRVNDELLYGEVKRLQFNEINKTYFQLFKNIPCKDTKRD